MEYGTVDLVRKVFEDSMEEQTTEDFSEKLVIEFARFETRLEEFERARAIYKHFLDRVPRSMAQNLHKYYLEFEKQYGDTAGIEHVVLEKRRVVYEKMLKENPKDYDTWLDLAKLEEVAGDLERIREVYERAIAEIPPRQEKRYWRRYIYIWLFYAAFEEIDARDMQRVTEIYKQCLKLIPHKKFTFAKVWLAKAYFHIRQKDLKAARLTLGQAIGMCPKNKIYREYIAMEVKLYDFGRCRKLYERWLVFDQSNMKAWKGFAELERALDDIPRARAIYEIAIDDSMTLKLDMPEVIWKDYIDMEIDEGEYDNARKLYERLLTKTSHVKVWISYAQFEVNITASDTEADEDKPIPDEAKAKARAIFERANKLYKEKGIKEDRVSLLQAWKSFEETHGTNDDHQRLEKMMPQQVKKRRRLDAESFEEFVDWVFPTDDEGAGKLAGLLARAKAWKEQKQGDSSGLAGDTATSTP
jgi:crooked neck